MGVVEPPPKAKTYFFFFLHFGPWGGRTTAKIGLGGGLATSLTKMEVDIWPKATPLFIF